MLRHRLIGEILSTHFRVPADAVARASQEHKKEKCRIGEWLMREKIITEKILLQALALQQGLYYQEQDIKPETWICRFWSAFYQLCQAEQVIPRGARIATRF
jgi:hypothetical protein